MTVLEAMTYVDSCPRLMKSFTNSRDDCYCPVSQLLYISMIDGKCVISVFKRIQTI